jgi:hypothetical protein
MVDTSVTRAARKIKRPPGAAALLSAVLSVSALSCGWKPKPPSLPATPILKIQSRWAVVTSAYARIKADPSSKAADVAYARSGSIVEVFARDMGRDSIEEEKGYWYGVRAEGTTGWMFSGYLSVYDSEVQAELASKGIPQ